MHADEFDRIAALKKTQLIRLIKNFDKLLKSSTSSDEVEVTPFSAAGFCPISGVRLTLEERADGTIYYHVELLSISRCIFIPTTLADAYDMIGYCNLHSQKNPKQSHHTTPLTIGSAAMRMINIWILSIPAIVFLATCMYSFLLVLDRSIVGVVE
eukprot:scaffold5099_cov130-Skeletonema_dohrnii-CCMP3373.AAC.1